MGQGHSGPMGGPASGKVGTGLQHLGRILTPVPGLVSLTWVARSCFNYFTGTVPLNYSPYHELLRHNPVQDMGQAGRPPYSSTG